MTISEGISALKRRADPINLPRNLPRVIRPGGTMQDSPSAGAEKEERNIQILGNAGQKAE